MIAAWLRRLADRLDPPDEPTWFVPPHEPPTERSDPLDVDELWRSQVADYTGYLEDGDVYRHGTYL